MSCKEAHIQWFNQTCPSIKQIVRIFPLDITIGHYCTHLYTRSKITLQNDYSYFELNMRPAGLGCSVTDWFPQIDWLFTVNSQNRVSLRFIGRKAWWGSGDCRVNLCVPSQNGCHSHRPHSVHLTAPIQSPNHSQLPAHTIWRRRDQGWFICQPQTPQHYLHDTQTSLKTAVSHLFAPIVSVTHFHLSYPII